MSLTPGVPFETDNNIFMTQSLDGLLSKPLQHFIPQIRDTYKEGDDFHRGVKLLISALDGEVENLSFNETELMIKAPLNLKPEVVHYALPDLSGGKTYVNPAIGSLIQSGSKMPTYSYNYYTSTIFKAISLDPANLQEYVAKFQNGNYEYFNRLHGEAILGLTRQQIVRFLGAFLSQASEAFSAQIGGKEIYAFGKDEWIFSNFNHASQFIATNPKNSKSYSQICYVDGDTKNTSSSSTANYLSEKKILNIFNRMNFILTQSAKKEIVFCCPTSVYQKILEKRREELAGQYQTTGIAMPSYWEQFVDANPVMDLTVAQDIKYMGQNGNFNVMYLVIPDNIWVQAFGSAKRPSYKTDKSSVDVYTIFALTPGVLKYGLSKTLNRIDVPAAPSSQSQVGIIETMQIAYKFSAVINKPLNILAVEVLADGIELQDEIPFIDLNEAIL
jgi:hypothetical protein